MAATGKQRKLQRRDVTRWLRVRVAKISVVTRIVVTISAVLLVAILQIPWLRQPLERIGFGDVNSITLGVIVFMLAAVFFEIRNLASERESDVDDLVHFETPVDLYPHLLDRMREVKRQDEKVLDVLGISLYTAWASIRFYLNDPVFNGWTLRFSAYAVDDGATGEFVPQRWSTESASNLDEIVRISQQDSLRNRGITLEAFSYGFVPVVHGFRLGNGDLYFSILGWEDGKIGRERYSYEYLRHTNETAPAEMMRTVFSSWMTQSCTKEWRISGTAGII